jgi:hypothetical protein
MNEMIVIASEALHLLVQGEAKQSPIYMVQ